MENKHQLNTKQGYFQEEESPLEDTKWLPVIWTVIWQFKAGTEEQQEFLWTTLVIFEEKTLNSKTQNLDQWTWQMLQFSTRIGNHVHQLSSSPNENNQVQRKKKNHKWALEYQHLFPLYLSHCPTLILIWRPVSSLLKIKSPD